MLSSRVLWIWYSLACGQGSRTAVRLLCRFGEPEKVYKASRRALSDALDGCELALLDRLADKDLARAREIDERCLEHGIGILTPDDAAYPRSLYQLRDAPIVLYYLGTIPDFHENCVCAVVGTRKMSDYGRQLAYDIGRGLAAGGAILVSGMALGNDSMAMAGALHVGGTAVAVLGCGVDIVYPPEHKDLMKHVLENGCVISEYPPCTPPVGSHFPVRNRLMSGLSDGVIVVEGDVRSGSLITARHALYQGRDLYAVPGRVGEPGAAGPNNLIKQGAAAITSAADVLRKYEFLYPHTVRPSAAEDELRRSASPDESANAATRMHISGRGDTKYYGEGLYGGDGKKLSSRRSSKTSVKNAGKSEAKITPKKMVERFNEGAPNPPKKMIEARHVELDSLGEKEKKIYEALVPDVPVLADDISVSGFTMAELMAGLTMLELCGAVECGAGGYYMRRSADEVQLDATPSEGDGE